MLLISSFQPAENECLGTYTLGDRFCEGLTTWFVFVKRVVVVAAVVERNLNWLEKRANGSAAALLANRVCFVIESNNQAFVIRPFLSQCFLKKRRKSNVITLRILWAQAFWDVWIWNTSRLTVRRSASSNRISCCLSPLRSPFFCVCVCAKKKNFFFKLTAPWKDKSRVSASYLLNSLSRHVSASCSIRRVDLFGISNSHLVTTLPFPFLFFFLRIFWPLNDSLVNGEKKNKLWKRLFCFFICLSLISTSRFPHVQTANQMLLHFERWTLI